MHVSTEFKNTLANYTESIIYIYIYTYIYIFIYKKIVFLPVDWDKNGLLLTKRLHMMSKIIGYS